MFKKVLALAVACVALGLTACGGGGEDTTSIDDMFTVNTESFESPVLTVSIIGSRWGNWDPAQSAADENNLFEFVDSSLYTKTFTVANGDSFKVIVGGTWQEQYGAEDINWEDSEMKGMIEGELGDFKQGTSNRTNFNVVADGEVTIEFRPYDFTVPEATDENGNPISDLKSKLTVKFTPTPATDAE